MRRPRRAGPAPCGAAAAPVRMPRLELPGDLGGGLRLIRLSVWGQVGVGDSVGGRWWRPVHPPIPVRHQQRVAHDPQGSQREPM